MYSADEEVSCVKCLFQKSATHDRDKQNSKMLRKWHKEEQKVVKLLLLGTGESGKSTVSKQMKIIHVQHGYNDEERIETIPFIRKNIKDAILTIVGAMSYLHIELEHSENITSVEYIMTHAIADDFQYPQEFYDHVTKLWNDAGVVSCYERAHEYQLIDSAKYFLDKVDVVRKADYIPTIQDILRNRVMTNTIQRMDFTARDGRSNVNFSVFDVGGQRGERRKWIQVFESVTAILFVIDCSCFDLALREDQSRNRLIEAVATFEQTWNTKFLRSVSVLLFLNKIDLLEEKIRHGKTLKMLTDKLEEKNPYKEQFDQYFYWEGPKEREVEEFVQAYPAPETAKPAISKDKRSKKPDLAQLIETKQISEETIRTAVFIKRLITQLTTKPSSDYRDRRSSAWHEDHSCEYYYTCAVDTQTIQKVFEGCRALLIRKHLERIGISV